MAWWFLLVAIAIAGWVGWSLGRGHRADTRPNETATRSDAPTAPTANEVLEELRLGIAISGRDGVGEFRNSAARAMAGTHAGILLDDAVERHLARGLVGIRSEEVVELHGPPKSVFVVRSAPLPSGGAVAFVEDISERRRIDQVRTDFVANVSHELKTPIGALSVLAETLVDETDLVTVHRFAGRMLAEAERAANTLDDLMELSRIELGGDRNVERVRVADVVEGAIDRVRELAAQSGISIATLDPVRPDGDRPEEVAVDGDRRQLMSAVGNLVENAVKYSEPNALVQVGVRHVDDVVEISVADHGVGIPAKDLPRVFERFYRVDQARSRATGGTGLGLSIVRHVATHHGGEVTVTSVEGEGSTFTLSLPAAQESSAADDELRSDRGGDQPVHEQTGEIAGKRV
ncbi:MAG TPA: ATP-binding protein [Ilumatobacter sp.]|nr:ATP-binding protein [Ilumatobacter sp.]